MRNILRSLSLSLVFTLTTGCGPDPDTPMAKVPPQQAARFRVDRVGVLADDLAYNGRRGIYLITDRDTGKEYVGVSGVGISDLASHQVGKGRASDER